MPTVQPMIVPRASRVTSENGPVSRRPARARAAAGRDERRRRGRGGRARRRATATPPTRVSTPRRRHPAAVRAVGLDPPGPAERRQPAEGVDDGARVGGVGDRAQRRTSRRGSRSRGRRRPAVVEASCTATAVTPTMASPAASHGDARTRRCRWRPCPSAASPAPESTLAATTAIVAEGHGGGERRPAADDPGAEQLEAPLVLLGAGVPPHDDEAEHGGEEGAHHHGLEHGEGVGGVRRRSGRRGRRPTGC